jgi:GT2 family glycosyltransferase
MIHILLPVHGRRPVTENFCEALARQTRQDFHLILIDDGSTDDTAASVMRILPRQTTVLRGTGKWWWGGALDRGWRWLMAHAPGDDGVVVICNDDVDLPDDFLAQGLELVTKSTNAFFVAMARDTASGNILETCFTIDYPSCQVTLAKPGDRTDCAPTRGLFIRWADMRKVGGFHPHLLPHYLSDLEWTLRATRRGISILRDDRLWLVPHHDKTGVHDLRGLPLTRRLGNLFSPKYAGNPLHWSAFIILCFPPRHWIPALTRVAIWTVGVLIGR